MHCGAGRVLSQWLQPVVASLGSELLFFAASGRLAGSALPRVVVAAPLLWP